jgi:hypothetical protein
MQPLGRVVSGGPWGYADTLVALADPKHERHAEILEWFSEAFDRTSLIPSRSKQRSPPSLNGGIANPARKPHVPRDAAAYRVGIRLTAARAVGHRSVINRQSSVAFRACSLA